METTLSTITIFPDNHQEIERYKHSLKNEILHSTMDPLVILKKLKYVEQVISDILEDKDIESYFLCEAYLFERQKGTNTFDHAGAKFTIAEVGTKYDYSECGDADYFDLIKKSEEIKEKIKARELFLKSIPPEGTVNPKDGNYINRPTKTSKTKLTVKL